MNSATPKFSMVIPAFNEAAYLPRLLESIEVARSNYSGGKEAIEVIVADNKSTDRTAEVGQSHGARVVSVEKRRIAAARNGGARVAHGEILCFIDADSAIHPQTFDAIEESMNSGRVVAGTSSVTLERWSFGLMTTYIMVMPLVWLTNLDTGVVFCRREDFEGIGGYDENRLYAEDVQFLLMLRSLGRPRGQRLTRLRGVKALACTRKFDQFGDWHYFGMLGRVVKAVITWNWNDQKFADQYWYNSGR